ncbi:hypothetical protein QBC34DRAFT_392627 [Podospora aff. communis PSN243]|uniref:Secreted protein n=1 Tax=Podospora aff. communis PSN243 TaxID=3040156 RepID=A0AAV9H4Z8_9PEZI|nr:hypothetical protein QBC34DRAFT_392627 [Podospora aff. communis PSN243]
MVDGFMILVFSALGIIRSRFLLHGHGNTPTTSHTLQREEERKLDYSLLSSYDTPACLGGSWIYQIVREDAKASRLQEGG